MNDARARKGFEMRLSGLIGLIKVISNMNIYIFFNTYQRLEKLDKYNN